MSINLTKPELTELKPKIMVFGVGGAGGNAVNNMIKSELQGVDFVVANTDAQALAHSEADIKIQLGQQLTQGLGAGSKPDVGRAAAEETIELISEHLNDTHMLFITAGMGGGTGTGAAPVIAEVARNKGLLTVGVVTKPFQFEGARRMKSADDGISELEQYVDTLIVIPNQNLFHIANKDTTFADAFGMADNVLHSGVRGITDLMVMPGLINLDFADIRTVMGEMGRAMMGTGEAEGEGRAIAAAEAAISNPLLDEVSMKGAQGVIINITGGMDLTLFEVDEAANHIRSQVESDADIIVGSAFNEELNGIMRVSVVATGIRSVEATSRGPVALDKIISRSAPVPEIEEPAVVDDVAVAIAAVEDLEPEFEVGAEMEFENSEETEVLELPLPDRAEDGLNEVEAFIEEEFKGAEPIELMEAAEDPDAFIAPEPIVPEDEMGPLSAPDAFAEADFENGPKGVGAVESAVERHPMEEVAETRTPSLFERMTGSLRGLAEDEEHAPAVFGRRTSKPQAIATVPADELAPPEGYQERQEPTGPADIGRLTPEDRPAPGADNELDIPMFLRRQAN